MARTTAKPYNKKKKLTHGVSETRLGPHVLHICGPRCYDFVELQPVLNSRLFNRRQSEPN